MRKHSHIVVTTAMLSAACLLPATLHAQEEHRELGAHVHGHGTLNIAIEDKRLSMELEVPGMDIVGFEHEASTDAQKTSVTKATTLLEKPLALFALPAGAGCKVVEAKAEIDNEAHHDDDKDDDGHGAEEKHSGHDDHDHNHGQGDDHKGHAEGNGHNQFRATYALDCASPSDLTTITFDYFKQFAGANALTVNVAGAKGQSKYEVSRDKPTLDLGGIM